MLIKRGDAEIKEVLSEKDEQSDSAEKINNAWEKIQREAQASDEKDLEK